MKRRWKMTQDETDKSTEVDAPTYEPPKIEVLGTLADLTLGNKTSGVADKNAGFRPGGSSF